MIKPCPGCGAIPASDARFCRVCGAPLKATGLSHDDGKPVSPGAQTVPLSDEGRPTGGVLSDQTISGSTPNTNKVGRSEMEELLRRSSAAMERALSEDGDGSSSKPDTPIMAAPSTKSYTTRPSASSRASQIPAAKTEAPAAPVATVASESIKAESSKDEPGQTEAGKVATQETVAKQPRPTARTRRLWQATAAVLLCVAVVAALLAFFFSDRLRSSGTNGAPPISLNDRKQLVDAQLSKAASLLASGNTGEAIAHLREAVRLDPTSAEAHQRLGEALEKSGARGEAITEYRAAAQINPNDAGLWRAMASAQFGEKLYDDAAESYRRLSALTNDRLSDEERLAYADALRLAGRTEEARTGYQRISASSSENVARAAKDHLSSLPAPAQPSTKDNASAETTQNNPAETAAVPAPSQPGVNNSGARDKSDSYYYQALNIVSGRDPKKLSRAELVRAMQLFQNVKSGAYLEDARRREAQLGKEYDRRRN